MIARYKPIHQADSDRPATTADDSHQAAPGDVPIQRSAPGLHNLEELIKRIFDSHAFDPK